MFRSVWKWIALGVVSLAVLGAGAYFGMQKYIERRNQTWLADAEEAYRAGNWQLAKSYYERYIPQDPTNANLLLQYAEACLQIPGNRVSALQSAAVAYQQVLTLDPGNVEVRSRLLELYQDMGAWGNVEYYTSEWLIAEPEDEQLRYLHALALDRLGRRDDAIDEYRRLAQANTSYSKTYANLSSLLRDRGLDIEAKAVLHEAVEQRPNDAQVKVDYARFLARERDWDRVDALLRESYALAPGDPEVLIAQAQAAGLREQFGDVTAFLQRAIEANPDDATSYLMLAGAYVAMDDLPRAVELLEKVDPLVQVDNPAVLITLGDLQLSLRRFDDARRTLERYSEAYPGQLPVQEYFAAKESLVKGNPREAIEQLAPVLQLRPKFLQAQYTLAVAYLEAGELELARNALEAYLARNPSDVRASDLIVQNFGEPISLDAMTARANELVNDGDAGPEVLYATGAALYESARRTGDLELHRETARELLQRCIEKNPIHAGAYRALIALEVSSDRISAARTLLDRAIDSGVPESQLAEPRVGVALASRDSELVREVILAAIAESPATSVDAYTNWARFLTEHDAYGLATTLLEDAIGAASTEQERIELTVAGIALTANHGDLHEAAARIRELDAQIPDSSPQRKRFNEVRLEIVQHLLAESSAENDDLAGSMVAGVRQEDPENPVLKTIDGFFLLREDPPALAAARTLFADAAAASPRDVNAQWGLARVAMFEQDYLRALDHAERAAAMAPDVAVLQLQLGEILSRLDRRLEAEKALKRVLNANPNNARALQLLIDSLIERKDIRQARELLAHLEDAGDPTPEDVSVLHSLRSRILVAEGDHAAAERLLRDQLSADPGNVALAGDLARTVSRQGRRAEAVELLLQFARSHPSEPEGWITLAGLHLEDGSEDSLEQASTALTRALLADPFSIPALRNMLNVRLRQGNLVESLGLCDRYLETNPDNAEILNTKALILAETPGQLDVAGDTIARAIALDNQPEYLATRGIILLRKKETRRALEDLLSAASGMRTTTARVDLALAEAYFETREFESAQRHYDLAVQKSAQGDPVNTGRLSRIGELLKSRDAAA